jgi:serine/threonine-protein kinase
MGEVQLVHDRRIGREVAVKVAHAVEGGRTDPLVRFTREARVQGQLEHPAIVPVYDLGLRPDGAAFFTMKRVRGATLEAIVAGLRRGDADIVARYSRRKLLAAFSSVCQAVHFAHTRGVLHRDVKPSNVMLGDFGEVYLLDWGLAKLLGEAEEAEAPPAAAPRERLSATSSSAPATTSGAIMGTPGYMAPEQVRGDIEHLDARTDVYALGALLFEILTWQPLHPRATVAGAAASTLEGGDARACTRAPDRDVPPELEAVCVRATALAPADRYPSARELNDAIERFLDGDRDLERRRELAADAAVAAEAAADRALAPGGGEPERREALQHAGRALALDPEHPGAMATMIRLLLAPPATVPADVQRDLDRLDLDTVRTASGKGAWTYVAWLLFVPLLFWPGVRSLPLLGLWVVPIALAAAISFAGARMRFADPRLNFASLVMASVAIVLTTPILGPYVFVPVLVSVNTIPYVLHSWPSWRRRALVCGVLTVIVPIVGDVAGWWPRTTRFVDDTMVVRSLVLHLPDMPATVVLAICMVGVILVPGIYVMHVRDALIAAQRDLHVQSWHLRQLIPAGARDALAPRLSEPAPLLSCPIEAISGSSSSRPSAGSRR